MGVRVHHVLAVACLGVCVLTAVSAKRASGVPGAGMPPAAVGYHGAMELYRNLALFFGKRALANEARYWEVIRHGG